MSVTASPKSDRDICLSVLEEVANCHDIDITAIDSQLGRTVDVDALRSLWVGEESTVNGIVSFDFYRCRVTVTSDGEVEATLLE